MAFGSVSTIVMLSNMDRKLILDIVRVVMPVDGQVLMANDPKKKAQDLYAEADLLLNRNDKTEERRKARELKRLAKKLHSKAERRKGKQEANE